MEDTAAPSKSEDLLSELMGNVLTVINSCQKEVNKLKGMLTIYRATLHSDKRFSEGERSVFAESIQRNLEQVKKQLAGAQKDLKEAERVWTEKQDLMRSWHEAGYLDDQVAVQWNKTQQRYQRQLERMEAFLQGILDLEL